MQDNGVTSPEAVVARAGACLPCDDCVACRLAGASKIVQLVPARAERCDPPDEDGYDRPMAPGWATSRRATDWSSCGTR